MLVAFYFGGVLANLLCAIAAICLLVLTLHYPVCAMLAGITAFWNGVFFLGILIPVRAKFGRVWLKSDGRMLAELLFGRIPRSTLPERLHGRWGLQHLWQSVGDHATLYYQLLDSAMIWVALNNPGRAECLYQSAQALEWKRPPFAEAMLALTRALVACGGRQAETARAAVEKAEERFAALHDQGGLFLTACTRATLLNIAGDRNGALATLERLAADPITAKHPDLARGILADRLLIGLEQGVVDERLWHEFQASSKAADTRSTRIRLFAELARFHARRDDDEQAEAAYRTALAAARSLFEEMTNPLDRLDLLSCQNSLVVDAHMCFYRRGKSLEEVADLDIPPPPREIEEQKQRRSQERRNFGRHVAAILLSVFALPVWMLLWYWEHDPHEDPGPLPALFLQVPIPFSLFCLIAGRWSSKLRLRGGTTALVLVGLIWMTILWYALALFGAQW
jgi:hypothetical protein